MNICEAIEKNAKRRPDHPAIMNCNGSVMNYSEYWQLVNSWATAMQNIGIGAQDIIGINLQDTSNHLIALYAIPLAGAVILPMDWRWTRNEKIRILRHFGARFVLSEPKDSISNEKGPWQNVEINKKWERLVSSKQPKFDLPEGGDSPLILSLSSGTTGTPKGPMISHQQFLARFMIYFITIGFSERDRFLCATPLYFGGCRGYSMCTLYAGGTVLMHSPPYDSTELLAFANKNLATRLFLVPTLLRRLIDLKGGTPKIPLFHSLKLLFSTGADLHEAERKELMQRFCPQYLNFYGSTDGGGCSALMWDDPKHVSTSVGRPVFGASIEIVDEFDHPVQAGVVGRIRYRHPGTANAYYKNKSESKKTFKNGWYYPGDLGRLDEQGYLFLAGREIDLIIRGGVNIYSNEIEDILTSHSAILEAAVVGWPSKEFGQEIAAFVLLKSNETDADVNHIKEHCRQNLATYKVPRGIFIVNEMPKSSVGKVLKRKLTDRLVNL